jgi:dihydroorotase
MTQSNPGSLRSCPPVPVLIRGVRLYGEGDQVDVLVADGQIAEIGPKLGVPDDADVIDATGQVLLPGFVDLHTHLREPGREYAEDIETGSAAAALGGFTAVFAMANTDPVADSSQSAVLQQVSNGVHVRMAVLFHLLVGTDEAVTV